ncbi:heterocyst development glycosyltransferase HepC [Fortiea contorta]|uniref:heterocyst development glycosyltransferase HepC n=1 Tax=Fortiea contorta TaxID=1892405 RepID=UPI00034A52D8|nr:heterocyst development glycosyltransferase HepC [Fortiea contorta]
MTISIIPSLEHYYNGNELNQENQSAYCTLKWRRGQLLVKSIKQVNQPDIPALHDEKSLVECLKHSPVSLVRIDPKLGETRLKFWAVACEQAHKPIFLCIPSSQKNSQPISLVAWWLKRIFDWILALVLLLVMTPVIIGSILLLRVDSPGSSFSHEWHVGERGKLFRAIKFRTHNMTFIERWLCKRRLHNLPQLLNVLRGEMRLFSSHCWTLEDAVRLSLVAQKQLNELPGIKSGWEIDSESQLFHLDGQVM